MIRHLGFRPIADGQFRVFEVDGLFVALLNSAMGAIYAVEATEKAVEAFDPANPIGVFVAAGDRRDIDRPLYRRPARLIERLQRAFES